MKLFYTIGIYSVGLVVHLLSVFNIKLRLGVKGRAETFKILDSNISETGHTIWMHCASLGEFEQGLPVLQDLKSFYKDKKVVVSFFSPSGYENKKHIAIADAVVYLPLDTPKNARRFLDKVRPGLIIFVKYDLWPNMLFEIKKRQLHTILISANFRANQSYFKWYGGLMRRSLFAFQHIFTQNNSSRDLLKTINYTTATVSGDTRFDRVSEQLTRNNQVDFIETFKGDATLVIFGSSWPDDDALFIPYINSYTHKNVKFVVAPHNVKLQYTKALKSKISKKTISYSEKDTANLADFEVLILDTIGYLSRAYSYADIAYVGGAAGSTGLHNILEPAVFGIPILIGKNYSKFPEAIALVEKKGVLSVTTKESLGLILDELIYSEQKRQQQGSINSDYILENKGAVFQINNYIRHLKSTIN